MVILSLFSTVRQTSRRGPGFSAVIFMEPMDLELAGRVAIVTGASRGIGRAVAETLAAEGMRLVLVARSHDALDDAARSLGTECLAYPADLREPGVPATVVEATLALYGRLDVLVNNAGATTRGDFLELSDEEWADGFALKFFGAMRLCRAAWPAHKPMGVRISAVDWVEGGWDIEDSVAFAKELHARGCDYICTSSGGVTMKQKIVSGPGYQVPFSHRVREGSGIATMAIGQITEPKQAEEILASGKADMIGMVRRLTYNPRWPWEAARQLGAQVAAAPQYLRCEPHGAKGLLQSAATA